jgi:hypothetical protein
MPVENRFSGFSNTFRQPMSLDPSFFSVDEDVTALGWHALSTNFVKQVLKFGLSSLLLYSHDTTST